MSATFDYYEVRYNKGDYENWWTYDTLEEAKEGALKCYKEGNTNIKILVPLDDDEDYPSYRVENGEIVKQFED